MMSTSTSQPTRITDRLCKKGAKRKNWQWRTFEYDPATRELTYRNAKDVLKGKGTVTGVQDVDDRGGSKKPNRLDVEIKRDPLYPSAAWMCVSCPDADTKAKWLAALSPIARKFSTLDANGDATTFDAAAALDADVADANEQVEVPTAAVQPGDEAEGGAVADATHPFVLFFGGLLGALGDEADTPPTEVLLGETSELAALVAKVNTNDDEDDAAAAAGAGGIGDFFAATTAQTQGGLATAFVALAQLLRDAFTIVDESTTAKPAGFEEARAPFTRVLWQALDPALWQARIRADESGAEGTASISAALETAHEAFTSGRFPASGAAIGALLLRLFPANHDPVLALVADKPAEAADDESTPSLAAHKEKQAVAAAALAAAGAAAVQAEVQQGETQVPPPKGCCTIM